MATATMTPNHRTVADLLERLGGIAATRVLLDPRPGEATEQDVVNLHDRENRLFELVNGTLVEKVMGFEESRFAAFLIGSLIAYLKTNNVGTVVGADGMMRLFPGLVRIPDAAFISWERFPKGKRKRGQIPAVSPDLIVEVLSKGNTRAEMAQARRILPGRSPTGLVRGPEGANRPGSYRPRSIGLAPRGSNAGGRRRLAGLYPLDPRMVHRSRADRGAERVMARLKQFQTMRIRSLIAGRSRCGSAAGGLL